MEFAYVLLTTLAVNTLRRCGHRRSAFRTILWTGDVHIAGGMIRRCGVSVPHYLHALPTFPP